MSRFFRVPSSTSKHSVYMDSDCSGETAVSSGQLLVAYALISLFNFLHTGYFSCLLSMFSKRSFRNTIIVSSSLDPDQARHLVGPDLGPNC